jgi:hypothetical protein
MLMQAINDSQETRPGPTAPGPLGLLIRVVLGAAAVYALVELLTNWDAFRDRNLIESDFWFITVFTLCLLADVFNIGLRRRWGVWPIVVFLAGAAVIGAISYLAAGAVWTTALGVRRRPAGLCSPLGVVSRGDRDAYTGMRAERAAEAGRPAARHGRRGDAALPAGRGPARQAPDAASPALLSTRLGA